MATDYISSTQSSDFLRYIPILDGSGELGPGVVHEENLDAALAFNNQYVTDLIAAEGEIDYTTTTFTVGATGCDYATIALALADIAPTAQARVRLLLNAETFVERELHMVDWLTLAGSHRTGTVIDATLGVLDATKDAIYATCNCIIENLTVIGVNCKYCIHVDATEVPWHVQVRNCKFLHNSYNIGIGLHAGQFVTLENCVFEHDSASTSAQYGVFCHNWNEQSAPSGLTMRNCHALNCGILVMSELGSEQSDHVLVENCTTSNPVLGIRLNTTTTYWDGGAHAASELPYSLDLHVAGGNCPYFEFTAVDRPALAWELSTWRARIRNVNAGTLVQGTAVAYKYSAITTKMDIDIASATRCDGVLFADLDTSTQGYMVKRGCAGLALCDTGAVAKGAWLKPNATTGQWEAATEATALGVAIGTKSAGSTGLVKLLLL